MPLAPIDCQHRSSFLGSILAEALIMGKHNGKARTAGMRVGAALMNRSKVRHANAYIRAGQTAALSGLISAVRASFGAEVWQQACARRASDGGSFNSQLDYAAQNSSCFAGRNAKSQPSQDHKPSVYVHF